MPNGSAQALHEAVAPQGLSVVILTFNEALHIERCICNARRVADEVLVVDSYSTDDTVARAQRLGARVLQNPWTNHATQMNWALDNGGIRSEWVMRLDADEVLDERLLTDLRDRLAAASGDIGGFEVNRRIRFMGREIRHGGMAPLWVTRFWRNGWARCEARWMDEHIVLSRGRISRLPGAIIDDNLNTLTWWTQKHNLYANREAVDLLDRRYELGLAEQAASGLNRQARVKRWLKKSGLCPPTTRCAALVVFFLPGSIAAGRARWRARHDVSYASGALVSAAGGCQSRRGATGHGGKRRQSTGCHPAGAGNRDEPSANTRMRPWRLTCESCT